MNTYDLVEMIIAANKETLEEHGVDLHQENITVRDIQTCDPANEVPNGNRNTIVTISAAGKKVGGHHVYYINRVDIGDAYTGDGGLDLSLSAVDNVQNIIDAIIATGDESLDFDMLQAIKEDVGNNLTLHFNAELDVDPDAYVSINSLKHFGSIDINLLIDREIVDPVDLSEILTVDILDGFEQSVGLD